jgi:hypothetical protein
MPSDSKIMHIPAGLALFQARLPRKGEIPYLRVVIKRQKGNAMIKVKENVNVKFNDNVKFCSEKEVEIMFNEQGAENLDEIAENLDATGYTSVSIEGMGDGYLFIF